MGKKLVAGALCLVGVLALCATAAARVRIVNHWADSPIRHLIHARGSDGAPSFSANLRGGVAFAGNTLLTCPENVSARKHRVRRQPHSRSRAQDSTACINASNNDHNMVYVNADPSAGHFDSSSATLTVPTGARVVKAFLYWGADLSQGVNRPTPNGPRDAAPANGKAPEDQDHPLGNTLWRTADLKIGSGSYTAIDATAANRDGEWKGIASWYSQPGNAPGFAYQVRADVTAEVAAGLTATLRRGRSAARADPVTVTVADVQAGHGYNRHGGWNLLVVWQSGTAPFRDITIFDGFDFVQVQGGQQLVVGPLNFTGFSTPASGKVDAHATTWTYEGDRGITGDYMALGDVSNACGTQTHLSDALHPVGNFFNSAISRGGIDDGDRTPDYGNQLGFDLATVNVPEGTIAHAANGASVCLGTVGDTYFFGGIVFDTLIRAPNVQINKVANVSEARPGNQVTYTTTVTNPQRNSADPLYPTAPATNLVVADPLPSGVDFAGFVGTPPCTYSSATRTINCNVGTLPADGSFTYSFTVTVAASAEGPAPNPVVNTGCFRSNSEDQPDVIFTGCDDATIIVPPQPPPQPQPADLGVAKTVSADIVAPGETLTWRILGTNYGPATSTGFVLADQLPAGVSFVSASADAPLSCTTPAVGSSGTVTCTAPSVPAKPAAGSSLTLTIVATVPAGTADGTLLLNIATVNGDQNEPAPDPHPNRDSTLTRVVVPDQPIPEPPNPLPPNPEPPTPPVPQPPEPPTPDVLSARLALQKRATPTHVVDGSTVGFALRVSNPTEVASLHVRVCDTLPHGLTAASAKGFTVRGRTLCAAVGRLGAVSSKTLRFTARVGPGAPWRITNRATGRASNARTVRARATIQVTAPPPPPGLGGIGGLGGLG